MELHTGWQWYSSKFNKSTNVNNITEAFEGHSLLENMSKSSRVNNNQIKSLLVLCKNCIKNEHYPLICLQARYAHGVHQMQKLLYYEKSLIEKYGYVPNADNTRGGTCI